MASPTLCPRCAFPLPDDAPGGHCPRCLLGRVMGGSSVDETVDQPSAGVLETIAQTIGDAPRVLLRDTTPGEGPSPIVRPSEEGRLTVRYRIDGEIARGGMGAILKGRDPDLGREVAIKVLREDLRENTGMVRRFLEEAQIGGQLQHPGVVPIYELGTFADRRPFFAMKLVKGQTLAALLRQRSGPADDVPRFLSIFQAIAQTMAYAHTRGVIHRDLKPSNVMVGSFGEVQVMDWGLAKVLSRGGAFDDARAGKAEETVVETARRGHDTDLSRAGSVFGTPSYMAPEQARGEVDRLDERCDVFALGSILCEVLTGCPAYIGRTSAEIIKKAGLGQTTDTLARLDACGADGELIVLARDCLAVARDDRPRDARVVADRVLVYLTGVRERLRLAEIAQASESARAEEAVKTAAEANERARAERQARRFQAGLAVSLLALTTIGGLTFTYVLNQRQAAAARVDKLLAEVSFLRDQAREHADEVPRWEKAIDTLDRLGDEVEGRTEAAALRRELQEGLSVAGKDRQLLDTLVDIRSARGDDLDGDRSDLAYSEAFRGAGLDVDLEDPAAVGKRIALRPPAVASALVAALDDWAIVRRGRSSKDASWRGPIAAARAADPEADRDALRAALLIEDKDQRLERLRPLVAQADARTWAPASLALLANALKGADTDTAIAVLERASAVHPGDVLVPMSIAGLIEQTDDARRDERLRALSMARAVSPETASHDLAHALELSQRYDEALLVFRDLLRRRPDNGRHLGCYARLLAARGSKTEAEQVAERALAIHREAIRRRPDDPWAHHGLGLLLNDVLKEHDGAEACFRRAVELKPDLCAAYFNLALALEGQGKLDDAVVAIRARQAVGHDHPEDHGQIGRLLVRRGEFRDAIASLREALRRQPGLAQVHVNLGFALVQVGEVDEGLAELREAIRLRPGLAKAHEDLGAALSERKGDHAAAEAELREAIRLDPENATALVNLGHALARKEDHAGAVPWYREAIRRTPEMGQAHKGLANALAQLGELNEAIAEFREALRLDPAETTVAINLARSLARQGKNAEALEVVREAAGRAPDDARSRNTVAQGLEVLGQVDEAVAEYRRALELAPDSFEVLGSLGALLCNVKEDFSGAEALFRRALEVAPGEALLHVNLGIALERQGRMDEALAEAREAVRLCPDVASHRFGLGLKFMRLNRLDEAADAFREAIRLAPSFPEAHCNLGHVLRRQGDHVGALAQLRRGHELGSKRSDWPYPSADWVRQAEGLVRLAELVPAVLRGEYEPNGQAERLALAPLLHKANRYRVSTRLWSEALRADPRIGEDRREQHRYNAACSAALAATGQGNDEPPPDGEAKAKLRRQALDWLKAELAAWSQLLETQPQSRPAVRQVLQHWKDDTDLAGVRDPEALAKLPDSERQEWEALWAAVAELLK